MAEGRRQRVREKVAKGGINILADHEKLEFLLYPYLPRRDTVPIARELLREFGSLNAVFNASTPELESIKGMPKLAALTFPQLKPLLYTAESNVCEGRIQTRLRQKGTRLRDVSRHQRKVIEHRFDKRGRGSRKRFEHSPHHRPGVENGRRRRDTRAQSPFGSGDTLASGQRQHALGRRGALESGFETSGSYNNRRHGKLFQSVQRLRRTGTGKTVFARVLV